MRLPFQYDRWDCLIDKKSDDGRLRHEIMQQFSRLVTAAGPNMVTPVALPPGRLRLSTRPSLTGSPNMPNTMGIVRVAALAICGDGSPPDATITVIFLSTRSAASSGNRS